MEDLKFEKALEKLEKIVEELEEGDLSLEDMLKKYEEGVNLSNICTKKLNQTKKKIKMLTKERGKFIEQDLKIEEEDRS